MAISYVIFLFRMIIIMSQKYVIVSQSQIPKKGYFDKMLYIWFLISNVHNKDIFFIWTKIESRNL